MDARGDQAVQFLAGFAERSGLSAARPPQRYLWTDAFAVCAFLGLGRLTGEWKYTELALALVDQVHHVLGRHRTDDRRTGWISGLAQAQGEARPTAGGLRIGKALPERRPDEALDERLEWDRDGQYFHYLTKWMHALDQVTRATGQPRFNGWARELAHAAHRAFTYAPRSIGPQRMYWKLSIDLSRPLVASMGQHDPLDGFVTCTQLELTGATREPSLRDAIADFAAMVQPQGLATGDPLGIGGLLTDAYRLVQLEQHADCRFALVETLLDAALAGLRHYVRQPDRRRAAAQRLAFRELGLAIGLAALERGEWQQTASEIRVRADQLSAFVPLHHEIENFWLRAEHRDVDSWLEHENINAVMLATSLQPQGFLVLTARDHS